MTTKKTATQLIGLFKDGTLSEGELADALRLRYRVNERESMFLARAAVKQYSKAKIYRNGWPDFLLVDNGRAFGVEVKRGRDDGLSSRQADMFRALECTGLAVFVWSPETSNRLVPWSKWPAHPAPNGQLSRPGAKRWRAARVRRGKVAGPTPRWLLDEKRERDQSLRRLLAMTAGSRQ